MVLEAYANRSLIIGDKFVLKTGIAVIVGDALVVTGTVISNKAEVDKMSSSYENKDIIGLSHNELSAVYPHREISVLVEGPAYARVSKDVSANQWLQGASNEITELYSGDATAQQELTALGNFPVDAMVSVTEDPDGTPTVLTRVYVTPTTDQYIIDLETGIIILGGTSTTGTDNYEVIYQIEVGRLEPYVGIQTETLVVTTHVADLTIGIEHIIRIEATAGTTTGAVNAITEGTVATKEAKLDASAKTLTFFATDAVTECKVVYRTTNKACAKALEPQTAGEQPAVLFRGVEA